MQADESKVVRNPARLVAGKWYACGFLDESGTIDWGGAGLYKYEGEGCWSDDDGEPVERLWDPLLQDYVAMDAADGYAVQS